VTDSFVTSRVSSGTLIAPGSAMTGEWGCGNALGSPPLPPPQEASTTVKERRLRSFFIVVLLDQKK
jgi:hypothetical protein